MGEADMIKAAVGAVDKLGAEVLPEDIVKIARQSAVVSAGIAYWPEMATIPLVINIGVMCSRINTALGIEIPKNKLNSIVSGLLVALGWQQVIKNVTVDMLKSVFPGVGTLALGAAQMYLFAVATYTAAFIYLKSLSTLNDVNKDNVVSDKIVDGIGDFAQSGKNEIVGMFEGAKDLFKNLTKSEAQAVGNEIREEIAEVRAEMEADGKNLEEEIGKTFTLDLDKEKLKPSKISKVGGWLKSKNPFA